MEDLLSLSAMKAGLQRSFNFKEYEAEESEGDDAVMKLFKLKLNNKLLAKKAEYELSINEDIENVESLIKMKDQQKGAKDITMNKIIDKIKSTLDVNDEDEIFNMDTLDVVDKKLNEEGRGESKSNEMIIDGKVVKASSHMMENSLVKYLNSYQSKQEIVVDLILDQSEFICDQCKSIQGQFQFETKKFQNRIYIIARGYCHRIKSICLDFYEYNQKQNTTRFIKKVILCKNETKQECIGMFLASIKQQNQYVQYCQVENKDESTEFIIKKLDLNHPEAEDEVIYKYTSLSSEDQKMCIGIVFCKKFYQLSSLNTSIGDNQMEEQNFMMIFYHNNEVNESKDLTGIMTTVEIRQIENLKKILLSQEVNMNITDSFYIMNICRANIPYLKNYTTLPCNMIIFNYVNFNYSKLFKIYEIKKDENFGITMVDREIPQGESEQEALKTEYKYAIRFIRNEIKYFSSYKFQWFYNFRLKRESKTSDKWIQIQSKYKPKAVFVGINNISQSFFNSKIKEVRLQKSNVIADQINNNIIITLLAQTGENNKLTIKILNLKTDRDQRSQTLQTEKMSSINKNLSLIFKAELFVHKQLSIGYKYQNLIHDEQKIYCFQQNKCSIIDDINYKFNHYNKNSLYQINYNWYLQFVRKGMKFYLDNQKEQLIEERRTMYIDIIDDKQQSNSQKFIVWPGAGVQPTTMQGQQDLEFFIIWNQQFNSALNPEEVNGQPMIVDHTQYYNYSWNPLQIRFANLQFQEDERCSHPFIGSKYSQKGVYEQIWIGMLDVDGPRVTNCHIIDLSRLELDNIRQISLVRSSGIQMKDGVQSQNYQICIWFGDELWRAKFYEYCITWEEPNQVGEDIVKNTISLVGMKELIGSMKEQTQDLVIENHHFFSLFNDDSQIIGSQLMFKLKNARQDIIILDFENFKNKDYKFSNTYCKFGFKIYNRKFASTQKYVLFEVRLTDSILDQKKLFSDYDRFQILFVQMKSALNMVFLNIQSYLTKDGSIKEQNFDFFTPLELLNGKCLCDFYLNDATKVLSKINAKYDAQAYKNQELEFYQDNLRRLLFSDSNDKRKEFFGAIGYLTLLNPSSSSLKNPLERAYMLDKIPMQTISTLITAIFEKPPSAYNQNLMSKILYWAMVKGEICPEIFPLFESENRLNTKEFQEVKFQYFFEHDSLPQGSNLPLKVFHFDPQLIGSRSIKNQLKDVLKGLDMDKGQSEYQIEYSYLDLRQWNLLTKMYDYRTEAKEHNVRNKGKIDHQIESVMINDTTLSLLIGNILEKSDNQVEYWFSLQNIVDDIFYNKTQKFFKIQFLMFIVLFLVPFVFYEYENKSSSTIKICMNICNVGIIALLFIKFIEVKTNGWKESFGSFWTKCDFALILTWFFDYYVKAITGFQPTSKLFTEQQIRMNFLRSTLVILVLMKVLSYLRTFENFAMMVKLLQIVMRELIYFNTFFVLLIGGFAVLQKVNNISYDYSGYPSMQTDIAMIIQTFENSIGNIASPTYDDLISVDNLKDFPTHVNLQIALIWLIWFLNQYFVFVIVLNFLISVIGNTYADVMDKKVSNSYIYKNELNIEYLKIRDLFKTLEPISCMIIISDKEKRVERDTSFKDFKDEVMYHINTTNQQINSSNQQIHSRIDTLEQMIGGINQTLQTILGNQTIIKNQKVEGEKVEDEGEEHS